MEYNNRAVPGVQTGTLSTLYAVSWRLTMLSVFDFDSLVVRVYLINGEPWFVAKDVCTVLDIANSRDAIDRLDDDQKGVVNTDTLGGKQDMAILSESGLYCIVFTSRKQEAKNFRRWLSDDVIPSIRKTGKYELKPQPNKPALMPDELALRTGKAIAEIENLLSHNPRLCQVLIDHAMNSVVETKLLGASNETQLRGVVEIAVEMGYKQAANPSVRTKLGKFVARQFVPQKEKRLVNGILTDINCYPESKEIRNVIAVYFDN